MKNGRFKKWGAVMDIFVKGTSSATEKKEEKRLIRQQDKKRERRRAQRDRRKSVNEGLVVSLSASGERRHLRDRRQHNRSDVEFALPEMDMQEEKRHLSVIA